MWSPLSNALILKEGIGTGSNGTTVSWSGSTTRTIQNVTYSSDSDIPFEMNVSWDDSSFKFTATFVDAFERGIHFVTEEGIVGQNMSYSKDNYVGNYTLLPSNFYSAYRIESPNPYIIVITFTITGQEIDPELMSTTNFTDNWSCVVEHDYDANMAAVQYVIAAGDSLKRYLEKEV